MRHKLKDFSQQSQVGVNELTIEEIAQTKGHSLEFV
jgi:hypothetical protein